MGFDFVAAGQFAAAGGAGGFGRSNRGDESRRNAGDRDLHARIRLSLHGRAGSGGADGRAAMNRRRPGIIFITAMWVIVILSALVLIFARSMRTEVAASSNRFSVQQADAVELGAEQYVLAAVDGSNGDAVTVLQTQAEQVPIGNGFFWILQTYPDNDYTYAFGITDESSKVNINFASSTVAGVSLANLPGMPQDVADSIVLWRGGTAASTTGQGA